MILARICTLYYFAHFVIVLPLIGLFEKPLPLPNSILESVTGVQRGGAGIPSGATAEPASKG